LEELDISITMQYLLKVSIFCLVVLSVSDTMGQKSVVDSLLNIYKKEKLHDSVIVDKIANHLFENSGNNLAKTVVEFSKLKKTDLVKNNTYYQTMVGYYVGSSYLTNSNYIEGIKVYEEIIPIAENFKSFHQKKRILQSCYGNLGIAYCGMDDLPTGLNYILKAIPYAKTGSQETALYIYNFAGFTARTLENYDRALEYYLEGLKYRSKNPDNPEYTLDLVQSIVEIEAEIKKPKYTKKVLAIADSLKNNAKLNYRASGIFYYIKGLLEKNQNKNASANLFFQKAIENYEKWGYPPAIAQGYYNLADVQGRENNLIEAKKNYQKALDLAYINDNTLYMAILKDASKFYTKIGDYKTANSQFEKLTIFKDSLLKVQDRNRVQLLDSKFKTSEKEREISVLSIEKNRQNTLIYSLIAGLLALSIIGFIAYRNIKIRKEIAEKEIIQLQQEKQLTATESIIKGQEEERSRLAKDLHDGLGGLLSGIKYSLNTMTGNVILSEQNANIFTRALGQLDNAIVEMRRVAHSMMPEALLKFGLIDAVRDFCEGINQSGHLKVHFQAYGIEERLNQSTEITLYRIVQELLNNVMKHAHATDAYVQLSEADGLLTLSVEDNGKGFIVNNLFNNKGVGMNNIESRVAYLNGKMDIQSKPDEGTSVNIEIAL
jgi:two-component system, NarL family, sensor kinase